MVTLTADARPLAAMVTGNPRTSEPAEAKRGEWTALLLCLYAMAFAAFGFAVPGGHSALPLLTALALAMLAFFVGMRSRSQPYGIVAALGAGFVIFAVVAILGFRVAVAEWAIGLRKVMAANHRVQQDAVVEREAETDANEGTTVE